MKAITLLTTDGDYQQLSLAQLNDQVREMSCTGLDGSGYPQYDWCDLDQYLSRHGFLDIPANRREYYSAMNELGFTGFE